MATLGFMAVCLRSPFGHNKTETLRQINGRRPAVWKKEAPQPQWKTKTQRRDRRFPPTRHSAPGRVLQQELLSVMVGQHRPSRIVLPRASRTNLLLLLSYMGIL
ncbi:hypothetical protein SPI_05580 [Niveomyces insectorum RCEF 264]|uniref:Uncharacterized protein n=1 Tax=Niveomyces insectorum RCEF 264 TaxID=1081102 RepID=A0A167TCI5_9HYPO|nr:hypothetical protein SPI_05580 [Niveomyces insectorum RCEF 264]